MIFNDTNVLVYAVGSPHPLQETAWNFLETSHQTGTPLCTSAEVVQELCHIFLPVGRYRSFDAAMELIADFQIEVWPLEVADVTLARQLHERYPRLAARYLCHLTVCQRRGIDEMMTFDQNLADALNNASTP